MTAEFGHYANQEGPEVASYGWQYANLQIQGSLPLLRPSGRGGSSPRPAGSRGGGGAGARRLVRLGRGLSTRGLR